MPCLQHLPLSWAHLTHAPALSNIALSRVPCLQHLPLSRAHLTRAPSLSNIVLSCVPSVGHHLDAGTCAYSVRMQSVAALEVFVVAPHAWKSSPPSAPRVHVGAATWGRAINSIWASSLKKGVRLPSGANIRVFFFEFGADGCVFIRMFRLPDAHDAGLRPTNFRSKNVRVSKKSSSFFRIPKKC